jgi:hypothetical protein
MNEPQLIRLITLGSSHVSTGKTRHIHGAAEIPAPHQLRIVKYEGDPGYYLLYCDESGKELTDTYHDTLDAAMLQATWEFNVQPDEWESPR